MRPLPDPEVLLHRAAAMIGAGRTGAARPVLAAAQEILPPSSRMSEISALLEMRDGNWVAARRFLDAGVEATPDHAGLRKLRAELRFNMDDPTGALSDAAESVIRNPHDPAGKALLGALLLQVGQAEDAALCVREAVAAVPDNPAFRLVLAAAEEESGAPDQAQQVLDGGVAAAPGDVALRNATIMLAVRQHQFVRAVELAEGTRQRGIADACTFGLLGHALSSQGRHEDAADAYREAWKLGPDDPYVRHLVASSGVLPSAMRAPDAYVRAVFDGYADRFESHLIALGYRVPGLLRAAMLRYFPQLSEGVGLGPVLDLGCGTGLVGVALSDLPLHDLIGVDLSPRMKAQADIKGIYHELHTAELSTFLVEDGRKFSAILAADVLCYFGRLDEPIAAMASALAPDGLAMFTVEELFDHENGSDWLLGRQGRYAHHRDYVLKTAMLAGMKVHELMPETIRHEGGSAVSGLLVVLGRQS